jgi:hypothetical protein
VKTGGADIFILPGLGGGTDDHWYRRWAGRLRTARIVAQEDWSSPDPDGWIEALAAEVATAERPAVIVAHSLGTILAARASAAGILPNVAGAFLVAPPDLDIVSASLPETSGFLPTPREPLGFPSFVIASRTDPYCDYAVAEELAAAWGSDLHDAGDAGHINDESGHGPWPEGLMKLGLLFSRLDPN